MSNGSSFNRPTSDRGINRELIGDPHRSGTPNTVLHRKTYVGNVICKIGRDVREISEISRETFIFSSLMHENDLLLRSLASRALTLLGVLKLQLSL